MALKKTIRASNGLPLSYHRVSQLDIETNVRIGIWVRSYLNEDEREAEKSGEQVFYADCYYSTQGPEGPITPEQAYEWLRTEYIDQFGDAEDC